MKFQALLAAVLVAGCASNEQANERRVAVWASASMSNTEIGKARRRNDPEIQDYLCDDVRMVRTEKLPPFGTPGYIEGTEAVIEYDLDGRLIRRWAVPANALPVAIDGQSLVVEEWHSGYLSIRDDGQLAEARRPSAAVEQRVACPAAIRDFFREAPGHRCRQMPDRTSGEIRLIADLGICE